MIVILGRADIGAQVADGLRVDLCCCVEAEADRDMLVFQITIDSLGAPDNLALRIMLCEILSEEARIRVRVVTTNHDETIEIKLLCVIKRASELLRGLNLVTSRT